MPKPVVTFSTVAAALVRWRAKGSPLAKLAQDIFALAKSADLDVESLPLRLTERRALQLWRKEIESRVFDAAHCVSMKPKPVIMLNPPAIINAKYGRYGLVFTECRDLGFVVTQARNFRPRLVYRAECTEQFWQEWRADKESCREAGYSPVNVGSGRRWVVEIEEPIPAGCGISSHPALKNWTALTPPPVPLTPVG